jgi:hypothetical protein
MLKKNSYFNLVLGIVFCFSTPVKTQTINAKGELLVYPYEQADLADDLTTLSDNYKIEVLSEIEAKLKKGKDRLSAATEETKKYNSFLEFIFGNGTESTTLGLFEPATNDFHKNATALKSSTPTYTLNAKKDQVFSVKYYNFCLLNFYESMYKASPFKHDDVKKLADYNLFLNNYHHRFKRTLDSINATAYSPDVALKLKTLNENITIKDTIKDLKSKLNTPWIKSWLWIREGSIMINPLNFSSKEFIESRMEFDNTKATKYNKFIDDGLTKIVPDGSITKVEDYKKMLNELNKGKDIFAFTELNKELVKKNEDALKEIVTTTVTLCQLPPEKSASETNYTDTFGLNYINRKFSAKVSGSKAEHPLTTEENKNIYVYNIPPDVSVVLKEKDKQILDQSGFQAFLGDVTQNLGQLAIMIGSLSAFQSFFDPVIKPPSVTLPASNPSVTATYNTMTHALVGTKSANQNAIEKYKHFEKIKVYMVLSGETNYDQLHEKFIAKKEPVDTAIKVLMSDIKKTFELNVYYLNELKTVFLNATPPPDPTTLKQKQNDTMALRTKLLSTNTNEDAVLKTVDIKAVKRGTKDTVLLKNFRYKIGKRYPFALSAGFVYNVVFTDEGVTQTSVTENAGQIEIKNTRQPYRFVAGIHIYPFNKGLFLLDDAIWPRKKHALNRLSIYLGCAISKKPLDNLYLGLSYDIVPGLKFTIGPQAYRNDKIKILNNTIIAQKVHYDWAGFIGLHIDPVSLAGFLTNINKIKQ